MKRLIATVAFAVFAAPVLATEVGAPYEQTQFDRGLTTQSTDNASSGSSNATGVWSSDYNFVSPAQ